MGLKTDKFLRGMEAFYDLFRERASALLSYLQNKWTEMQDQPIFIILLSSWVLQLLLLGSCVYLAYRWIYKPFFQDFLLAERCIIQLENTDALKVGDSVILTISGFTNYPPGMGVKEMEELARRFFNSLTARVTLNGVRIPAIKAFTDDEFGCLRLFFTADKSGTYHVELRYNSFLIPGSPLDVTVPPDFICHFETDVVLPSNPIIVTDGMPQTIEIYPKDRTGYPCSWEGVRLDKFDFHASTENSGSKDLSESCRKSINVIGGYELWMDGLNAIFTYDGSSVGDDRSNKPVKILLTVRPNRNPHSYGIFEGQICYDGLKMKNGCIPIISLTPDEYERVEPYMREPKHTDEMQLKAQLLPPPVDGDEQTDLINSLPGTSIMRDEVKAESPTTVVNRKEVFVNISIRHICVKEVVWTVLLDRTALFPVRGETKIEAIPEKRSRQMYTVTIEDTAQNLSVRLLMSASNARMLMTLFLKFRGITQGSIVTFNEKSQYFFQRVKTLSTKMAEDNRDSFQLINVSRPDVIRTSHEETKEFEKSNWYNPFVVSFLGEPLIESSQTWLEWSGLILDSVLENNPNGMFQIISEKSGYIHPNPSRSHRRWNVQYYELAGKIVGKYLVERATSPASLDYRVKARFSRSFLLQLIGSPPSAGSMERDLPELFESTLKLLNKSNQQDDRRLTFCIPLYDNLGKVDQMAPLIENGEHIQVTEENTQDYLNALARHHLASKVSREIRAFRHGLIYIIPEDFLLNFDENELELLLCGWTKLDINEMKQCHAVIGEHWHPQLPRIMKWFWNTLSVMSPVNQARFLQFSTGSSILPDGGFQALNPRMNFSMTCLYGQLPVADPTSHNICLSDHPNYEAFDEAFLTALRTSACCQDRPRSLECRHGQEGNGNENNNNML